MRSFALLLFGFALLVVASTVSTAVSLHGYLPNLLLPMALFLGVRADVHIVRGAALCFVLGYLIDSFTGNPMGLQTFTFVASFLAARGAGLRLLPQGPVFQIFLSLAMALVSGALVLALRAVFERAFALDWHDNGVALVRSAVATAVAAPFVFLGMQRIAGGAGARAEERAAS